MSKNIYNRDETRLLILGRFYEKYYHGGTYTFQNCSELFADLIDQNKDGVIGDLVYMIGKKWINPIQSLGSQMPNSAFITETGIDMYENAMRQASNKIMSSKTTVPKEIEEDLKAGMWDKVDDWMTNHPAFVKIFSRLVVGAMRGDLENVNVD